MFAYVPNARRTDGVMGHHEAGYRRSPPPKPSVVHARSVGVLLTQLLEQDDGPFVGEHPAHTGVGLASCG